MVAAGGERGKGLVWVWVGGAVLGACGGLGGAVCLLLLRGGPAEARGLLVAACLTAFAVGMSSAGSVLAGARLLAEGGKSEPLRLREAAWLLGVAPGLLAGVLYVLGHRPELRASFLQAFVVPLVVPACLVCLLWAVLGRAIMRLEGLRPSDYACAVFLKRYRYEELREQKLSAASRRPTSNP